MEPFYHLLIKNVLDGIFNSFKIADIHHCHFFRSVERGSGVCKTFFRNIVEIQFHSHIHVTMCIHFMLVSTVEYKKAELNNQMENTKEEEMVAKETKYLNDNSK